MYSLLTAEHWSANFQSTEPARHDRIITDKCWEGVFFFLPFFVKCVVTNLRGRGWNTDDPTCLKPPPFVPATALFANGCLLPPLLPLDGGGVAGLTLASWWIPTVAKVLWTVSWPPRGLICRLSWPAERIVLRQWCEISEVSHRRLQTVYFALCLKLFMASGSIAYPEDDPHRVEFLYMDCPTNLMPGEFWQRPSLSDCTQRKKKEAPVQPEFSARVLEKMFQCYWQSSSSSYRCCGKRQSSLKASLTQYICHTFYWLAFKIGERGRSSSSRWNVWLSHLTGKNEYHGLCSICALMSPVDKTKVRTKH